MKNLIFNTDNSIIEIPTRDQIDERYKWNLSDIYTTDVQWENDFNWVSEVGFKQVYS